MKEKTGTRSTNIYYDTKKTKLKKSANNADNEIVPYAKLSSKCMQSIMQKYVVVPSLKLVGFASIPLQEQANI